MQLCWLCRHKSLVTSAFYPIYRHPMYLEERGERGERGERCLQSPNILNIPIRLGRGDRSSTSSTESDNSVETSVRPARYSDGTKVSWDLGSPQYL